MKLHISMYLVAVVVSAGVLSGCGSAASDTAPATAGIAKSSVPGSAQTGDAKAVAAKALVRQVQNAIESCAAGDASGSYANCGPAARLVQSSPDIAQALSPALSGTCQVEHLGACVSALTIAATSYSVTATAATLPQPTWFTYAGADGLSTKTCRPKTTACSSGTW